MTQLYRGDALGPFIIEKRISSGGMATVYLCRPATPMSGFPPHVAVKVAKEGFEDFLRDEEDHLRHLQHPNIIRPVPIPFVTEDSERKQYARCTTSNGATLWYLVLEHLEGGSLADLLQIKKRLPAPLAAEIASQIAMALDHLHRVRGVAHLDVRPDNILFRQDPLNSKGKPEVVLCDFGISWRVQKSPEESYGDLPYVAPERRHGSQVTESCDIYSLGVVLYEMLTGRRPYPQDEKEPKITDAASDSVSPDPPSKHRGVSSHLDAVVQRAIARVPGDRYATASGFLEDLAPIRLGLVAKSGPMKSAWRHVYRWAVILLSISFLASVLVIAGRPVWGDWLGQALSAILPQVVATPSAIAPSIVTITSRPKATNAPSNTPSQTPLTVAPETFVPTASSPTSTLQPTPKPITPSPTPSPTASSEPTPVPVKATKKPEPSPIPQMVASTIVPDSAGSLTGNIAFAVYNPGIGSYTLYVVQPDGSGLRAVADYVHQPDINPNGTQLVAEGVGGGKDDLWTLSINGGDWRQLTHYPDDRFPTWSPNGLVVSFSSKRQGDGVYRLYLAESLVATDRTKFIMGDYPVLLPTWAIAFNGCDYGWGTGAHCGLWQASNGHLPSQITDNPQDIPTDGTKEEILFLRPEGDNWDVYRMGITGGTAVRLTDSPGRDGPAAFSPDGKAVAFVSDRGGSWALYTMNRQGGNLRKVMDLPLGGNYDRAPNPWSAERISWGQLPAGPKPAPKPTDSGLLPAPQITFPIPDDVISASKPTQVRWSWDGTLTANQGFQVRFWSVRDPSPQGVAPPTSELSAVIDFRYTQAYIKYGQGMYYLDVVVVQRDPEKVLSSSARIRVQADPNK